MATRFFSDAEITRLRSRPDELGRDELIGFFTLDVDDRACLGLAVQLCAQPWLGFVPDDVAAVPKAAANRVALQLGIPMADLAEYGARPQTRTRGPAGIRQKPAAERVAPGWTLRRVVVYGSKMRSMTAAFSAVPARK